MPVISTNTAANTSLRYLNENSAMQSESISKIASGKRIERASDDASGLAVSTSLRSDISVLEQSAINADQGISVLQTADGALARMDDVLQRMSSLSAQAINGGVDDDTRAFIDAEFQELVEELDDIAASTDFNGASLLDGSYDEEYLLGTDGSTAGANTNRIAIELEDFRTAELKGYGSITSDNANAVDADYSDGNAVLSTLGDGSVDPAQTFTFVTGTDVNGDGNIDVNDEDFVQVDFDATTGQFTYTEYDGTTTGATRTVTNADNILTTASTVNDLTDAFNATGVVTAGVDSNGELVVKATDQGAYFGQAGLDALDGDFAGDTTGVATGTSTIAIADAINPASVADADGDGTTGDYISVDTLGNAEIAADVVNGAIFQVSEARAEIGAQISRFEYRAAVVDTSIENLKAANSAILDADIAAEQINLTNSETLTEAAIAALAKANELPAELLRLLQ